MNHDTFRLKCDYVLQKNPLSIVGVFPLALTNSVGRTRANEIIDDMLSRLPLIEPCLNLLIRRGSESSEQSLVIMLYYDKAVPRGTKLYSEILIKGKKANIEYANHNTAPEIEAARMKRREIEAESRDILEKKIRDRFKRH